MSGNPGTRAHAAVIHNSTSGALLVGEEIPDTAAAAALAGANRSCVVLGFQAGCKRSAQSCAARTTIERVQPVGMTGGSGARCK